MKLRPILLALAVCSLAVIVAALNRPGPSTTSAATVTQASLGNTYSCARQLAGTVKCWGFNTYGLGDGTTLQRNTPVDVCATGAWNGSTLHG